MHGFGHVPFSIQASTFLPEKWFYTKGFSNFRTGGGTSLVVQWLRLRAPNAGGLSLTPGQGTRSHMLQIRVRMLQLKIPCASFQEDLKKKKRI